MGTEVAERRNVREHEDELRVARKRAIDNAVIFGAAMGLAVMLLFLSIGEYEAWPLVVWGTMTIGMACGLVFNIFEFSANFPPREIVEVVEIEAVIDEPTSRMMVSIGANSLGLSRIGLKPMQWRALADGLYNAGLNWNRAILQETGNWGNLTVGKTYPDLVEDWEKLRVVEGRWKGEGDTRKLLSAKLVIPEGWDEIQKMAGTHYEYTSPAPLVTT